MQANKLFDLDGKVALVTGGSRGIGFQMAEALGEMGCKLAISARKQHELDAASAALRRTNIEVLTIAKDRRCARDVYTRWPELPFEEKRRIVESITERVP